MNIPVSFIDASSNINYNKLALNQVLDKKIGFKQLFMPYYIQKPYDKQINERFAKKDNLYNFIIYDTDLPHLPTSLTEPRTEMRFITITNYTKTYKIIFYFYSPQSSYNHSLMQILSDSGPVLQVRILKGIIKIPGINWKPIINYNNFNRVEFNLYLNNNYFTYKINVNNDEYIQTDAIPIIDPSYYFKVGTYNLHGYEIPFKNELFIKDIAVYESI